MSDYTPLDHEVRNRAIIGAREIGVDETEAERQYDRWLAEHDAAVWDSGNHQGFDDAWNISSGTYSKRVPNPYRS